MTIARPALSPGISSSLSRNCNNRNCTFTRGLQSWQLSISSKHHPYGRRIIEFADEAGADKAPAAQSPEERVVAVLAGERLCVQCQRTYAEKKMMEGTGGEPWLCVKCYVALMLYDENKDCT